MRELDMAEVIRTFRCLCTPYASLLMMFVNLPALTGRSAISLPSSSYSWASWFPGNLVDLSPFPLTTFI